ncbi:iron-sulfur cluster assembly scaffold protein [Erythrobacter donghaensis]|uniref:iron-sulfur cluster assembly scaffold protein n=1 Tax=Erythrobacter donghaensis TaxID=267135 RepID=UPI001B802865|nr:iron-sulfur cluster assembly scaffold protein [Erythrobacter donghaensis]
MSARVSSKLYSPELLGLATGLADFPLTSDLPLRAEERSRTCGSVIALGLAIDDDGLVSAVGINISACAIGQASAAVMAQAIRGDNPGHVRLTATGLERWLAGEGELPLWPSIAALTPARDHPGRHGALLLPWKAASAALSQAAS